MEDIKSNISENLIMLRKAKKLTQQGLAKQLNYSDKAISRWELGDSLPDINVLIEVCKFYGVDFDWLTHKHQSAPELKNKPKNLTLKILIVVLFAVCCFTIATVVFVYGLIAKSESNWISFVIALPVSLLISTFFSIRWWPKKLSAVLLSLTLWATITAIFLWFIPSQVFWPFYLIGIPLQAIIALLYGIKKEI